MKTTMFNSILIASFLAVFTIGCTTTKNISEPNEFNFKKKTVLLNSGYEMPILGIGTYKLDPDQAENSVYHALLDGYRLIDTANAYMNEKAIGRAIDKSGVSREKIFVTTKLWPTEYESVSKAIDETLVRLDVDYIDLVILHQGWGNIKAGYQGLEQAVADGKVRSIGISNFYEKQFDELMTFAKIPPAVLQNETNPFSAQKTMRAKIAPYGTIIEAWYPLGGRNNVQGDLFSNEVITSLARKYGKSSAQIVLRWHMQSGIIAIPGSSNPAHILENISIFDFELTDEEMQRFEPIDTGTVSFDFSKVFEQPQFRSIQQPRDYNNQK